MPSTIITRTISGNPETAIQMSNSSWGRPVSLPSTWSKVRVGIRAHATPNAALSGVSFGLGFCSGTVGLLGDYSTTHFVGLLCPAWTSTGVGNQLPMSPAYSATKVGATTTLGPVLSALIYMPAAAAATADRMMFFVDMTKGSPNYTLSGFIPSTNGGVSDASAADFLTQMQAAVPAFANHAVIGNQVIAVNEALNGTLNTVTVWWSPTGSLVEICDLAVVLLA